MYFFITNFDGFCFRTGKNYYSQVFLEKGILLKKMPEYITDKIQISSDHYEREFC